MAARVASAHSVRVPVALVAVALIGRHAVVDEPAGGPPLYPLRGLAAQLVRRGTGEHQFGNDDTYKKYDRPHDCEDLLEERLFAIAHGSIVHEIFRRRRWGRYPPVLFE